MDAKEQFNNQAKFYSSSKTFSAGESLNILSNLISKKTFKYGLDVGTGAGFAAFELSKSCEKVEATDISEGMINEARKIMKEREINNLSFNVCFAEELKYSDKEFDIVTCRTAAHHFLNVEKFCNEVHRVLKDDGELIIVDTITSDQIKLNKWHQNVELIRDKSHIKNLSLIEWKNILKKANFKFLDIIQSRVTMNLNDWMERSGTSEKDKKVLLSNFQNSDEKTKRFFGIKNLNKDISFYWPVGIFHLKKLS
tara:strand:+ start:27 stop:785 length:759 start_codon:yes stop_codon:yes gene_type:complete